MPSPCPACTDTSSDRIHKNKGTREKNRRQTCLRSATVCGLQLFWVAESSPHRDSWPENVGTIGVISEPHRRARFLTSACWQAQPFRLCGKHSALAGSGADFVASRTFRGRPGDTRSAFAKSGTNFVASGADFVAGKHFPRWIL